MPECVEVEIIRRKLCRALMGKTLRAVAIYDSLLSSPNHGKSWQGSLTAIERRGKALRFVIDGRKVFTVRLGMSGSLQLQAGSGQREKPEFNSPVFRFPFPASRAPRLAFEIDGIRCVLIDPRRFGRISWEGDEPRGWDILNAISGSGAPAAFGLVFESSRARIKSLLMDQNKIAGLGNIYANEILYAAGIHPSRMACRLTSGEVKSLWRSARQVLSAALRAGGSSMRDYYHPDGAKGSFQEEFKIYGRRKGALCLRCRTAIKVLMISQRSTFYCPKCQK